MTKELARKLATRILKAELLDALENEENVLPLSITNIGLSAMMKLVDLYVEGSITNEEGLTKNPFPIGQETFYKKCGSNNLVSQNFPLCVNHNGAPWVDTIRRVPHFYFKKLASMHSYSTLILKVIHDILLFIRICYCAKNTYLPS